MRNEKRDGIFVVVEQAVSKHGEDGSDGTHLTAMRRRERSLKAARRTWPLSGSIHVY
jgi:hypothetical protein